MSVDLVVSEDPENEPLALAGVDKPRAGEEPIDRLKPNSELHRAVLDRLLGMYKMSRNQMTQFYDRWAAAELQYQAYLKTETFDQLRAASNKRGTPPELVTITVPYTYSALNTIVTYLLHTFCGSNPMFQVGSYRSDTVKKAQNMELVLQYNGDHERIIRKLFQFFLDGEMYGLQVFRVMWKEETRRRTVWKPSNVLPILGRGQSQLQPTQETAVTFEGNEVRNVDPFKFFPDPRVPMEEVAEKGEFVFWKEYEGRHTLKKAEADGLVKWIADVPNRQFRPSGDSQSQRGRLSGGRTATWGDQASNRMGYELLQGSVEIIPSEWGLGDSDNYEKWLFTIANEGQIIQAEALNLDHGRHPVVVGEPHSVGYEFGQISAGDMLGPLQEMLSWMFNSHIFNVRSVLNNSFLVNPQMVDMEDLKKPGPGRIIKLKPAAFGQDVKNAFSQIPIQDVTAGHIQDMQIIQRFADNISATNDNLRGVINTGGRKSATEVRQSGEAGASRLASHARLVSAQSICPLAEMQTINLQQKMSQEVYLRLLGPEGMQDPLKISPEDISGDFYFPVHDGTLPLDRVALLDVWKEIFALVLQTPGLAQVFDAVGMFQYIAELGGAKNLSTFRIQTAGNEQIDQALTAGNLVPGGAMQPRGAPPGAAAPVMPQ